MGWSRGCTLLLSSTTTFPHAPRPSIPFPGLHKATCAHIYFKSTFYNPTDGSAMLSTLSFSTVPSAHPSNLICWPRGFT